MTVLLFMSFAARSQPCWPPTCVHVTSRHSLLALVGVVLCRVKSCVPLCCPVLNSALSAARPPLRCAQRCWRRASASWAWTCPAAAQPLVQISFCATVQSYLTRAPALTALQPGQLCGVHGAAGAARPHHGPGPAQRRPPHARLLHRQRQEDQRHLHLLRVAALQAQPPGAPRPLAFSPHPGPQASLFSG